MADSPLTSVMKKFGQEVVEKAMLNLGVYRTVRGKKRRAVASDTLRKSLSFYYDGRSSKIQFFAKGKAANYADFVEQGVNGLTKNQSSPYSFRKKVVAINPIIEWMKIKPIRIRDKNGKIVKQTPSLIRSKAYAIAKGIAQNGIPPLFYWREAVNDTIIEFKSEFEEALTREINLVIEDNLQKKIKI